MSREQPSRLSRREFLTIAGASLGAIMLPVPLLSSMSGRRDDWPALSIKNLPDSLADIISRTPQTAIDQQGYLTLFSIADYEFGRVPLKATLWNIENSTRYHRLKTDLNWGIVLHWFGEKPEKKLDLNGYMRGFNGLHQVGDYYTRTSAHFLVGEAPPSTAERLRPIGIIQTQKPDLDGIPYVASHLRGLSFQLHQEKRQYFVRALYRLAYEDPTNHSILQDFYDGRWIDPNMRTIAIEVAGRNFDDPQSYPSSQKLANLLSVIWAVMKRYRILSSNILGHMEIQMDKVDPGKGFMALMRLLVGVKALVEQDDEMNALVFGQFLDSSGDTNLAVQRYFKFVRDYLMLVSKPVQLYEWEARSQYWPVHDILTGELTSSLVARQFYPPITGLYVNSGYTFLDPKNHEGIDLLNADHQKPGSSSQATVQLVAGGRCLFASEVADCHHGKMAIFRHRQVDGAQILSVYSHLGQSGNLRPGAFYPAQYPLGQLSNADNRCGKYMHFAMAYGSTWESDLSARPYIPYNAGPTWIRERYLDPLSYLHSRLENG